MAASGPSYLFDGTNWFPSASLKMEKVPHTSFLGSLGAGRTCATTNAGISRGLAHACATTTEAARSVAVFDGPERSRRAGTTNAGTTAFCDEARGYPARLRRDAGTHPLSEG